MKHLFTLSEWLRAKWERLATLASSAMPFLKATKRQSDTTFFAERVQSTKSIFANRGVKDVRFSLGQYPTDIQRISNLYLTPNRFFTRFAAVFALVFVLGVGNVLGDTFALVTNVNQLSSGDEIIIANTGGTKAMSTTQNGNNRGAVDVSVSSNKITSVTGLQVIILGTATKSNTTYWTLQAGSGNYLYAASSSSNYLRTKTTLADECKWSISLNGSNEATITSQGTFTRNIIKNNGSLFSCYSSGQTAVKIYKKITLSSIAVKTAPTKVSYTEGENFDPTGLVIRLTYSDNSTEDVTYNGTTASNFTFSPTTSTSLTTSHISVSITYGGKSTSQAITVAASGCTNSITINKGSESHGTFTLSESGPQATCSGLSVVVTPDADDHYHVSSVSATTGETGTDNGDGTWTITYAENSTGSSTINVVFAEDNKYTLNYHDGSGDDTKINVYEGTNLITALGTPAASCDATSTAFQGWSTTEIATKTNTPPTYVAANDVVNSTTVAATYYAVYAKQGELESVAGGDIASGFGTTGLEGSHSDFYSGNGFKFKAANNYVTTGDISSNNYKDVTVKLKAGHNGGSGSILTIASLDKDGNTIDSETLTPSEAYTSQSTTYTFELSGSKVIKEVRVTMTSKTNNLGMKYCEVFHSSLSDYMTTCCEPLAQINGSVNLSRWVKNLCGCKGTFFLRDMQEKRKKNEPIFALWHFGGGKCRKCKAKRDENFYIGGIACRGMEEDERTGDVRRKGGVSYPPNLVDAKEETPNERKRGTKVPRTGRRRKTAWRGNAKRKGTGYNINTDY